MGVKTQDSYYTVQYTSYNGWEAYLGRTPWKFVSNTYKLARNRTGDSLPKWKQKIARKESATTGFSGLYTSVSFRGTGTGQLSFSRTAGNLSWGPGPITMTEYVSGNPLLYFCLGQSWSGTNFKGSTDSKATNKFLQAVRETQTEMSAPTFIGELRQTQRMLRNPAEALLKNILEYERGLKKAKKTLGPKGWIYAIPDLWLEASFGWKPLMMDIDDAWNALASMLDTEHTRVISKSSSEYRDAGVSSGWYLPNGTNYSYIRNQTTKLEKCTIRYKGAVVVDASTTFGDKAAKWGFTPGDFFPTVWELLPWSFLADYFISIGDFIEAAGARRSGVRWVNKSTIQTRITHVTGRYDVEKITSIIPKAAIHYCFSDDSSIAFANLKSRNVTREAISPALLTPDIVIRWDGPKWGQIANISALFGSFSNNLHQQTWRPFNWRR